MAPIYSRQIIITRRQVLVGGMAGTIALAAEKCRRRRGNRHRGCLWISAFTRGQQGRPKSRMRSHALAHPGGVYRFPAGVVYDLSTPRFLYGVEDIEINAHGAALRNISAGTFGYSDLNGSFSSDHGQVLPSDVAR